MVSDWGRSCGSCLYSGRKCPEVVRLDPEIPTSWFWALPLHDSASNPAPSTNSLHPLVGGRTSLWASAPCLSCCPPHTDLRGTPSLLCLSLDREALFL